MRNATSQTTLITRAGDLLRIIVMNYLLPSSTGRLHAATFSPRVHRVPAVVSKKDRGRAGGGAGQGPGEGGREGEGQEPPEGVIRTTANQENALQISGPLLDAVLQHFHKPRDEQHRPGLCPPPPLQQVMKQWQPLQEAVDAIEIVIFQRMRRKHKDLFVESRQYRTYFDFRVVLKEPVNEDDFALYRVLGRGGFGIVNGCKHRFSGKLFAMKVLHRKRIKSLACHEACLMERNLLASLDTPFVAHLAYAFQSPTELFLIMELMTGGDLKYHLHRKGRFNASEAKYFAARTVLGLQAIHNASVAYRDLKPENILMASDGATKLSDFGLAATVTRKGLVGACGTRGYW